MFDRGKKETNLELLKLQSSFFFKYYESSLFVNAVIPQLNTTNRGDCTWEHP